MIKTILKDSFVYGILNAVNKFFTFIVFFIYVSFLSKETIAVLDMIIVFSFILSIFISMQLESSFARFYFNRKENNEQFDLLKTIVYMMFAFVFLYLVPAYIVFELLFANYDIDSYSFIFPVLVLSAFLVNITNLVNLHFRYSYERKNFILSSCLYPVTYLIVIAVYIFLNGSMNMFVVFTSQLVGLLLVLFFQYIVVGKQIINSRFQTKYIKEIFRYSLPMLPMFFLIFANDKAIIYILREFITLDILADFSVATRLLAFLSLLFFALRMALEPKVNHFMSYPNDDSKSEFKQYINIYIFFSIALFGIFTMIIPYIQLQFFPNFVNAAKWSVVLAISLILLHMGTYMTPGFGIKKRMDIKLLIVLAQVVFNFVGFYFVLKNGHSIVLALKYIVFINYVFLLVQHYISNKLYKVSNEYLKATALFSLVFIV